MPGVQKVMILMNESNSRGVRATLLPNSATGRLAAAAGWVHVAATVQSALTR
jgi:hypothetical protein